MRKGIIIGVVLVAMLALYAVSRQSKGERPCRKLMQACQAAGYKRGKTPGERKAFYESCLKPLMINGSLGEIQVDPNEALACKQKLSQRRKKDEARDGSQASGLASLLAAF